MKYEIAIGLIRSEGDLPTRNILVEADDELTAVFRAGSQAGSGNDSALEVIAVRSEKDFHENL